jgi:hypothetical protein
MKKLLYLLILVLVLSISCKSKQAIVKTNGTNTTTKGATTGKVSHKYKSSGCSAIIIVNKTEQNSPMVLIPIESLPESFNKDGMEISFDYHLLKVKNPDGCSDGIPAEIINISKK